MVAQRSPGHRGGVAAGQARCPLRFGAPTGSGREALGWGPAMATVTLAGQCQGTPIHAHAIVAEVLVPGWGESDSAKHDCDCPPSTIKHSHPYILLSSCLSDTPSFCTFGALSPPGGGVYSQGGVAQATPPPKAEGWPVCPWAECGPSPSSALLPPRLRAPSTSSSAERPQRPPPSPAAVAASTAAAVVPEG